MTTTPRRLSSGPIESQKSGIFISLFWWAVFVIPMIFAWVSFNSWQMVVVLLVIRFGIMAIPHFTKKKTIPKPAKEIRNTPPSLAPATINTTESILSSIIAPIRDELKSELYWLLRVLRMRDDREEMNLIAYRKFRGWK